MATEPGSPPAAAPASEAAGRPFQGAGDRLRLRALLVGERLDLRALSDGEVLAPAPLTVSTGERGCVVLLRYGAAVLIELAPNEERAFLEWLAPHVTRPFDRPESEDLEIVIGGEQAERLDAAGELHLQAATLPRLQAAAIVLAKSVVLAHYEAALAAAFDELESMADALRRGSRRPAAPATLLRQIGHALQAQARMVGRVEVGEKPELVWDRPDIDRLYERLCTEYELVERDAALTRKLELMSGTAETALGLLHARRSLRVEWYIVVLIVIEILLSLYAMATGR